MINKLFIHSLFFLFALLLRTTNGDYFMDYHNRVLRLYSLQVPIQVSRKPLDLDQIYNCECPRVYWPVCGRDGVTYVNHCIANCLKAKVQRNGPCILYRRSGLTPAF